MSAIERAVMGYKSAFGQGPTWLASAPGRVNLIGEHTDYNDGFAMPVAIDLRTVVAARPGSGASEVRSPGWRPARFSVSNSDASGWARYVAGIPVALTRFGFGVSTDIHAVIESDVPVGAGLSSSAALECAFVALWAHIEGRRIEPIQMAAIARWAENNYVGVPCGVLDQAASCLGKSGHAMLLDTRSMEVKQIGIPKGLAIALCDTGTRHSNSAADGYARRVAECRKACQLLGVASLREADLKSVAKLPAPLNRRATFVIQENERCQHFAAALAESNVTAVGELMKESHQGLRMQYEVTSPELDAMEEACRNASGCVGARMTGAGFGGACIALVEENRKRAFERHVLEAYGYSGKVTFVRSADGAEAHTA